MKRALCWFGRHDWHHDHPLFDADPVVRRCHRCRRVETKAFRWTYYRAPWLEPLHPVELPDGWDVPPITGHGAETNCGLTGWSWCGHCGYTGRVAGPRQAHCPYRHDWHRWLARQVDLDLSLERFA